jgi:hypothetical protein
MKHEEETPTEKKSAGGMTELARRILLTGLGAIFMTEESLRKNLGDLKIPKDALGGLLDSVVRQKDDLLELVAAELSKFLSKIKVHEELQKALSGLQLHVDAKLNFGKKHGSPPSEAKVSVHRPQHKS